MEAQLVCSKLEECGLSLIMLVAGKWTNNCLEYLT